MAGYLKKIFIIGNVGRDPEERFSQDGRMYINFSVAVNDRPRRNQAADAGTGGAQPVEQTTWFRVTAFGRQAEIVKEYVRKGTSVFVSGDLTAREYPDPKTGQQRTSLDITMQDMQLLTPKGVTEGGDQSFGGGGQAYGGNRPAAGGQSSGGRQQAPAPEPGFGDEDDIPF